MKRSFLRLTAIGLLYFYSVSLKAQSTGKIDIVTTAVPFLRISPDARAGGMGELGVATSPDANSSFYNLAKTPFAQTSTGIGLTYTPWLKDLGLNDVYLLAFSGYHKLDDQQAITASLRYFSLGNIQFTDYSGSELGVGRPRELGADIGYSRKLSDKISLALALRYIHSDLAAGYAANGNTYKPGNAVAGDVSFFYNGVSDVGRGWRIGAAITNLGSKIGYTNDATAKEYIPANLAIGVSYTWVFDEQNKVTFGLDANKLLVPAPPTPTDPTDEQADSINLANYHNMSVVSSWFNSFGNGAYNFSVGGEYGYNDQFFFRTGYFYEPQSQGGRQYFTVGIGIKYNIVGLNFSYLVPSGSGVTRNPLSNTIRFGLVFDIDGGESEK
ncbi:MAG TPA: type IX secretion system outer membrane channel protein PorV [Puia sp.]|nr:type IX secretion system outer membrane channel protein PorV [Puia sp.]